MEIGDVEQQSTANSLTRYTKGNFKTLEEAENFKDQLISKGVTGSFVIALYNNELIPIKQATDILGK